MIWSIVRSLLITLTASSCVSGALYLTGVPFWPCFIIITFVQIIGWQVFEYIVSVRTALKNKKLANEQLEIVMKNSASVPCANCKTETYIPILFNAPNGFKCEDCGIQNVVYISLETAQTTVPIESLKVEDTFKKYGRVE